MFKALLICAILGLVVAAHAESHSDESHAEIVALKGEVRSDGFDTTYETSNHIESVAKGDVHGNIVGHYSYIAPNGEKVDVNYVADENGFQATGTGIHPIPEAIKRSLEWNAAHAHEESHH